jgi:glutaredoxin 2
MGKKMLPIVRFPEGRLRNESLDIIEASDTENLLASHNFQKTARQSTIDSVISSFSTALFNLAMPFYALSGEFSAADRKYFLEKKSAKRGSFEELLKRGDQYRIETNLLLQEIEKYLTPFFESTKIRIEDIMLASHLWGLYMVPEFRFSDKIHLYLQDVKNECHFRAWDGYGEFLR